MQSQDEGRHYTTEVQLTLKCLKHPVPIHKHTTTMAGEDTTMMMMMTLLEFHNSLNYCTIRLQQQSKCLATASTCTHTTVKVSVLTLPHPHAVRVSLPG